MAPSVRAQRFNDANYDFFELFRPEARWSKSASRVQVFQATTPLIMRESDENLKMIFTDLKRRHIALGVEMGLVAGVDDSGNKVCGQNVEGFAAPDTAKVLALRIQKNGGDLRYIAMDEPLWYGHYFHGPNACQWSPDRLAAEIAARVQVVRQIFPDVKIGDIEPLAPPQPPDWTNQIIQWTQVYRRVAGEPLSFVRADIVWTQPWQGQLASLKSRLRGESVQLGVIFNGGGDGREQNDENWTDTANQRARTIQTNPALTPDHIVIQTWVRWPTHLLPEDQPGTLTNLLLQCEQYQTAR